MVARFNYTHCKTASTATWTIVATTLDEKILSGWPKVTIPHDPAEAGLAAGAAT